MIIENKEVKLRILKAEDGKIIVSKKKIQTNDNGDTNYAIKSKKIYLAKNDSEENYIEIEDI